MKPAAATSVCRGAADQSACRWRQADRVAVQPAALLWPVCPRPCCHQPVNRDAPSTAKAHKCVG